MPELVVFDVDGTLFGSDGRCSTRTRGALARLREADVMVAIATGRPMAIAQPTLDAVGATDWAAFGNGSVVVETASGLLLRDRCLPPEVVAPIITGLRQRVEGIGFAVECSDSMVIEPGFARRVPEPTPARPVDDVLAIVDPDSDDVRRVIPFHDDYDSRLPELAKIADEFLDDRCQVAFGGVPIIDISPKGDNKAVALQVLVDHLEIDAAQVLAFGDGSNDIEMLKWAGTGVAMANANRRVRDCADVVTEHVDDGGVAAFVDQLFA